MTRQNCHCRTCAGVRLHVLPGRRYPKPRPVPVALAALREGMAAMIGKAVL